MKFLSRFLLVKIAFIVLVAVLCGFAVSAWLNTERQLETIERLHGQGAQAIAQSLATGVRNSMLRGEGLAVSEFVHDAKQRIALADIHVFAPDGEEVFGDRPPVPMPEHIPPHVREAIATRRSATADRLTAHPIPNEARCQTCHTEGKLRGVLTLGTERSTVSVDGTDPSLQALSSIARSGFIQLMTGRKDDDLESYFSALVDATPGIEGVVVMDNSGDPYFTGGTLELDPSVAAKAVQPGDPFTVNGQDDVTRIIPLPMEPRCQGCHDGDETMRGALAVRFKPAVFETETTLVNAVKTSLQHVMLAGLGRLIVGFLDEVSESGLASSLTVHESNGRLYHDAFQQPNPPPLVREVLTGHQPKIAATDGSFHFVTPMHNEVRCQSCHGTDKPLRGAISVTLDTRADVVEIKRRRTESLLLSGFTVLLVILLLYIGLRWTVLRPVKLIGDVADAVAAGRLDVSVELNRVDEMGRLADQINEMTRGLRQRLQLAKFVSDETFRTVEAMDEFGRSGSRRRVTVLFSDIRGFTAFSETRQPEEVVEMLNAYLQVQAEVVLAHGGDIDKFVGDELMARFDGPDQEAQAIRAAVEILEAVARLNRERGPGRASVNVGVGVNAGDAIVGAMGAETRMDYTVIGDSVNLGARLCAAAKAGEVLVSEATHTSAGDLPDIAFEPIEPLTLKGKTNPTPVSRATREPSPTV